MWIEVNARLPDLSSEMKTVEAAKVYPMERYTDPSYVVNAVDNVKGNVSIVDTFHTSNLSSKWGELWDIADDEGYHCSREEQMGQVVVNDISGVGVHRWVASNAKSGARERGNVW